MTRDEVKAILIRHVHQEIPELQSAGIDPDKSYQEVGIDSLTLSTVLTETIKEMKIKVQRDKLGDINTLNELADFLAEASK